MAESWKEACWKAEQELAEFKNTVVPALMERIRELEAGERAGLSEREKVYTNAYIRYGEIHQAVVAMEELSECQKEIAKFIRGLGDDGRLAEEVADALICLEQIMMVHGIRERVDSQMERKVLRLEDKLRREANGAIEDEGVAVPLPTRLRRPTFSPGEGVAALREEVMADG